MGVGPMTSSLPKRCATAAPRGHDKQKILDPKYGCRDRRPLAASSIEHRVSSIKMVAGGRFELPKRNATDLQSAPFGHSGIPPSRIV